MAAIRFFKTLILTYAIFLIFYYFPNFNEIDQFLRTDSVSLSSDPGTSSSNSEPSFYGEENWPTDELELCNNPSVDKTWTHGDALCFVKRRGLELTKIEIISWSDPLLVIYRDMFTSTQINGYDRIFEKSKVEPEKVVDEHGNETISSIRVVNGSLTDESEYPEVQSLIATATKHVPAINFQFSEQVLGLSYLPGGHYGAHHDFLEFEDEAQKQKHLAGGNRLATFIIPIVKADVGGGTVFPYLGATVRANPGDAYIWFNMLENEEIDRMSYHGGCPVISGRKLIATIWLESGGQHIFESVEGKNQSFNAEVLLR